MKKSRHTKKPSSGKVIIGRVGGAKINAVEGVVLTRDMQGVFRSFDKADLSPAERRARLKAKYGKSSA